MWKLDLHSLLPDIWKSNFTHDPPLTYTFKSIMKREVREEELEAANYPKMPKELADIDYKEGAKEQEVEVPPQKRREGEDDIPDPAE